MARKKKHLIIQQLYALSSTYRANIIVKVLNLKCNYTLLMPTMFLQTLNNYK